MNEISVFNCKEFSILKETLEALYFPWQTFCFFFEDFQNIFTQPNLEKRTKFGNNRKVIQASKLNVQKTWSAKFDQSHFHPKNLILVTKKYA